MSNVIEMSRVLEKTTLARSTIYALMQQGNFPSPAHIGRRRVWIESEIDDWLRARIQARRVNQVQEVTA